MPFCRACGEKSPPASLFCARCGYRLRPLLEEVTSQSDPHTTHVPPAEAPTLLTRPLQGVPTHAEEEEEERRIIPPLIPPKVLATGNVPSVSGTPQVGTVPSIPGGPGTGATTLTAGTMAKALVIVAVCAAVIFTGVKVLPLLHPTATPTARVPAKATTVPVPPTQTSCPQAGTARAAVMSTLVLGTHQDIVYVKNDGQGNAITGTLWRYDITTHQTSRIKQLANGGISYAQISTDGQWVLFASNVYGQSQYTPLYSKLQMVRVDGQGLQTLYCSVSAKADITNVQWSPDQRSIALIEEEEYIGDSAPIQLSLLNASNGKLQKLSYDKLTYDLGPSSPKLAWLDNTHIYFLGTSQVGVTGLYILDTTNAANQQSSVSQIAANSSHSTCWDATDSYDGTKLFVSQCDNYIGQTGGPNGQSSITGRPAIGGTPTTIYTTATFAVTSLCVATKTSLLLTIGNTNGNMSHNGLWKMNTDGTGLTQLASDPTKTGQLNEDSGYSWANVSRDGRWYTIAQNQTLIFGSMSGGPPTSFVTGAGSNTIYYPNGQLELGIVGWTSTPL